jgi:hypothetical protein
MMRSYIFIIKSQNPRVVVTITATYNSYICTAISKYILEQFVVYDLLEPDALQGASPVLRGRDYSDIVLLPDHGDALHDIQLWINWRHNYFYLARVMKEW